MFKNIFFSFALAFQNIRSNIFHTVLSVLGIVIGVAALVAILSFIDGLEHYAKEQITKTTSLNSIVIRTNTYHRVDDIRLRKDSFALLDYAAYTTLLDGLEGISRSALFTSTPTAIQFDTSTKTLGAMLQATTINPEADTSLLSGRALSEADMREKQQVVVVSQNLAKQALGHERFEEILDKPLRAKERTLTVVGVLRSADEKEQPKASFPISLLSPEEIKKAPPTCLLDVTAVEQVPEVKEKVEAQLKSQFPKQHEDLQVITNDFRLDQAAQGFLLFRIVMGLIVGISIVVGGVGVMNVLLISVNERTTEIGIRKAVGAKRQDIMRQFLAESITVSAFGSFLGLIVGVLATMIIIPIVKLLTELPFEAVYTWDTFFTISIIAVLVGIIFGTYPAMKASKLDPVEAIRRE